MHSEYNKVNIDSSQQILKIPFNYLLYICLDVIEKFID